MVHWQNVTGKLTERQMSDAAQENNFCRIEGVNTLYEKNVAKRIRKKTIFNFWARPAWLLCPGFMVDQFRFTWQMQIPA